MQHLLWYGDINHLASSAAWLGYVLIYNPHVRIVTPQLELRLGPTVS